jgi:quinol monooxygenase YgiN
MTTTPTTLAITHDVADYAAWYAVFTEHATTRKEHGCLSEELFAHPDQPNSLMNVMRFPTRTDAQSFLEDPSLRAAMERAGVISAPRIEFWTTVQTVEF